MKKEIIIWDRFKSLIPPLSTEELEQLEKNILKEGIREPLIVWPLPDKSGSVLIDGHNRYTIAQKHGIFCELKELSFSDSTEAENWMVNNQLGRRNLTEETKSYLRGKQYEGLKKNQGRPEVNVDSESTFDKGRTIHKLAEQHKVSAKTIQRDEKYAQNIDQVTDGDQVLKQKILNREIVIPKKVLSEAVQDEDKSKKLKSALSPQEKPHKIASNFFASIDKIGASAQLPSDQNPDDCEQVSSEIKDGFYCYRSAEEEKFFAKKGGDYFSVLLHKEAAYFSWTPYASKDFAKSDPCGTVIFLQAFIKAFRYTTQKIFPESMPKDGKGFTSAQILDQDLQKLYFNTYSEMPVPWSLHHLVAIPKDQYYFMRSFIEHVCQHRPKELKQMQDLQSQSKQKPSNSPQYFVDVVNMNLAKNKLMTAIQEEIVKSHYTMISDPKDFVTTINKMIKLKNKEFSRCKAIMPCAKQKDKSYLSQEQTNIWIGHNSEITIVIKPINTK